jgi:hypothetical protein
MALPIFYPASVKSMGIYIIMLGSNIVDMSTGKYWEFEPDLANY